jgi:hypothetical protein
VAFYKLLESSILFVLCDIRQQVGTKHWDELQQFYGFLMGLCSFYKIYFYFSRMSNFCFKNSFYNEKHIKASKLSSKKYSKIGLVGISNTIGLLMIVYY